MKSAWRIVSRVFACALVCCPWAVSAQGDGPSLPLEGGRATFLLGGSMGASAFSYQRAATAGWLTSAYTVTTPLAPGDSISTFAGQDRVAFGAKLYAGTWITSNLGFEGGLASLGRIGWSAYSTNTTGSFFARNAGTVAPHAWYESLLLGFESHGMRYFIKAGAYEASTDLEVGSFNDTTGAANSVSEAVHNNGALAGVGIYTAYGHTGLRLEVEDYMRVGQSSMPLTSPMPPWRGSVVLVSAGVAYVF